MLSHDEPAWGTVPIFVRRKWDCPLPGQVLSNRYRSRTTIVSNAGRHVHCASRRFLEPRRLGMVPFGRLCILRGLPPPIFNRHLHEPPIPYQSGGNRSGRICLSSAYPHPKPSADATIWPTIRPAGVFMNDGGLIRLVTRCGCAGSAGAAAGGLVPNASNCGLPLPVSGGNAPCILVADKLPATAAVGIGTAPKGWNWPVGPATGPAVLMPLPGKPGATPGATGMGTAPNVGGIAVGAAAAAWE